MKIVITEAATVAAGGVTLEAIGQFGEVVSYDYTAQNEVAERIKDADIVLCNKVLIGEQELKEAKNLKYIGLMATGYNNIDADAARKRNITVCNAGSYSTDPVAQLTFAYILEKYCRLSDYRDFAAVGGWRNCKTFSPILFDTFELSGKTIGIIGFGSIGKKVARIADGFGMRVICYTRTPRESDFVEFVSFEELLEQSDIVSVNCPLTSDTENMFSHDAFSKMKKGAYLINTARGPIVDEYALAEAVISHHLSGAALDVLREEPMSGSCPLIGIRNITITPHTAWTPVETRERLVGIVCDNIKAFLEGKPQNRVI